MSSSMASSSSLVPTATTVRKTMEEVWKDINLRVHPTNAITNVDFSPFPSTPLIPHPTSGLTLDPGPEFSYMDSMVFHQKPQESHHHQCNANAFTAGACSDTWLHTVGSSRKKRMPESTDDLDRRRHKRMIKNRETAARSRARKQAYTDELELKLEHLMKENAKLRKEQQQRCLVASIQLPAKNTLYRTSTAPF